jgi:uncharacterized peroxidase-related enzyme
MTTQVALVEYDQTTDAEVKAVYDDIIANLGFGMVPNLFKSMGHHAGFLRAHWTKFSSVILHGALPRTLKEMIGVAISQRNHSDYALKVHLHGLSALGISEEVLRTLVEDFDHCPLPMRDKAAIQFGVKAATAPHELTRADFEHLSAIGLESEEIYEILATANLFTSVNQYTDAIRLEIDKL